MGHVRILSFVVVAALVAHGPLAAKTLKGKSKRVHVPTDKSKKSYSLLADYQVGPQGGHGHNQPFPRRLSSGNDQIDLQHYHNLKRRLGVDLGVMIPLQDFADVANMAPAFGIHFIWEAIAPFGFTVSYRRASSNNKTTPANGKLSVNQIGIGTQASFPTGRFIPFVTVEGTLNFNDYRNTTANVTGGDDALLTTIGLSAGFGADFIVGREVSIGLISMIHYQVPKKVTVTGGTFDLGSAYATIAFRLNF